MNAQVDYVLLVFDRIRFNVEYEKAFDNLNRRDK